MVLISFSYVGKERANPCSLASNNLKVSVYLNLSSWAANAPSFLAYRYNLQFRTFKPTLCSKKNFWYLEK